MPKYSMATKTHFTLICGKKICLRKRFALDFGCGLICVRQKTGHFLVKSLTVAAREANGEPDFKSNCFSAVLLLRRIF